MEELEIVPQYQISGMRMFVNTVEYRSPHFHPEWELLWVLDAPLHITSAQKKYEIQQTFQKNHGCFPHFLGLLC